MKRRIAALEKKYRREHKATCGRCGGPVPGFSAMRFNNEAGEPKWGACPECGLLLDPKGRPICPWRLEEDQAPWTKVYGPSFPVEAMGLFS